MKCFLYAGCFGYNLTHHFAGTATNCSTASGSPAFAFGLAEDLTKRVGVLARLLATMASGVLAWAITGYALTSVNVWGVDYVLQFTAVAVVFTAFAVGGVANAINIIDGLNGLASSMVLWALLGIAALAGLIAAYAALGALIRGRWVERFDVPGMRAKGTRLLKPDVLTRDLTLDEAALEEKERRDREKLEKMVQLCYANTCRQQWVLEYFGEVDAPVCGSCDVCRGEENSERRAPSDDEDLIVRKFLSGVARMSRRTAAGWEGIFGRGRIVQMLLGSKSQEVLRVRLHELKTYGILKKQGTAYLNALARSLNNGGLIVTQMGEYPLVTLTPRGEQVMMGKTSYSLEWPSNDGGSKTSAEGVDLKDLGFDGQLYDRLKDVRTRLAKASQVPAYVIFSNDTLEHLARLRPKTMDAGLLVKGIGEAKAEKYLEPFLKVIRQVDQGE